MGPVRPRGSVAGPLGTLWPPWGRGCSTGPIVAAVGAWQVPWAHRGRCGGVADPLGSPWPPSGCGQSFPPRETAVWRGQFPGPCEAAVMAWLVRWALCRRCGIVSSPLGIVWPLRGRGRSPGPRVVAMGAWPVPWALCGRLGGVAGSLGPVWPPWGPGRPLGLVW